MPKKVSSQLGSLRVTSHVWSIDRGSLDRFDIQCVVSEVYCKNVIKSDECRAHNLSEQISTPRFGEGYYRVIGGLSIVDLNLLRPVFD